MSELRPSPERLRDRADARCSELVLRNHDRDRGYHVTVELTAGETGGRTVVTYQLAPGEIRCPADVAPRGQTRVVARLDGGPTDVVDGVLGGRPGQTAVIEVGNGLVSATRGL
ncbi:MAG: hypothetical protein ABEJ43_07630 [Haloferacaceae archaeon]